MAGLDLACVRHLIAGAEIVPPGILEQFTEKFAVAGLAPDACQIGYGMTECVFMATLTPPGMPPRIDRVDRTVLVARSVAEPCAKLDALSIASCGAALEGVTVCIRDEIGVVLPERTVGEIVIASPALFERYLNQTDLTQRVLEDGWLHTGDLGYLADGELFVVDRKDDVIITEGQHIYPELLEQTALAVLDVAAGRAAAFGVFSEGVGVQLPVIVVEVRGRLDEMDVAQWVVRILDAVSNATGIYLADVRLVRRGWLEVTTSGKVARRSTREKYLAQGWRPEPAASSEVASLALAMRLAAAPSPDQVNVVSSWILAQWCNMLGIAQADPGDSFFALGGDSILAMQMLHQVETEFDVKVASEFFREPTARHLAVLVTAVQATAGGANRSAAIFCYRVSGSSVIFTSGSNLAAVRPGRAVYWRARTVICSWHASSEVMADNTRHTAHVVPVSVLKIQVDSRRCGRAGRQERHDAQPACQHLAKLATTDVGSSARYVTLGVGVGRHFALPAAGEAVRHPICVAS
ncbi:MAG: non-ribosomal peptide synthetase [Anaerolineales bacterium]|nr:non-ribosomal peptide synthetase [Anaerolineales bacterium]